MTGASLRERQESDPGLAELTVVTRLRAEFGRLPRDFYLECFQLYREQLDTVSMAFEPILEIGPTAANVSLFGWEALARTTADSLKAPAGILQAAEVWGTEFIVERDRVLAERAIHTYSEIHHRSGSGQGIRPLSINVRCAHS
jgi:hypothetical protein